MDDVAPRVEANETKLDAFRIEVRQEFEGVRKEFESVRREIRDGNEESRRFMRVLYEDLVARITTLGDELRPSNGQRRPRKG